MPNDAFGGFFAKVGKPAADKPRVERKPRMVVGKQAELVGNTGCDACPLKQTWANIFTPRMPLSGNTKNPDVLVLGEGPGEEEDRKGEAFVGPSGVLLTDTIPGRHRSRLAFTNAVRCRPANNRTPTAQEVRACSTHTDADIERHDFKAILGVGGAPLRRFFSEANITDVHGHKFPVQLAGKTLWYYPILHPAFVLRKGGEQGPLFPVFRAEIRRFFDKLERWPTPRIWQFDPKQVALPQSRAEAEGLLAQMSRPISIDLETTELRPYTKGAKLLTASISDGKLSMAFGIDHPTAVTDWGLEFLLSVARSIPWIAHNAAFELIWLMWFSRETGGGLDFAPFDDTMAKGRLYHETAGGLLSLGVLTHIHLGVNIKSIMHINTEKILQYPITEVLQYNGLDTWSTTELYRQIPVRDESNYKRLLNTIQSTTWMELFGLDADLSLTRSLQKEWQAKAVAAEEAARKIYEVREFEHARQMPFRISSNEHVGIALVQYGKIDLPKTKKAQEDPNAKQLYSTDDEDLAPHIENPLVKQVLAYREATKMDSTYMQPVIAGIDAAVDGKLHPEYTCCFTATGRLSSEHPNIQNFPKRKHKEIRAQIVAPPGHLLVAFDYGQLEARVLAMASRDERFVRSIISGEDIHAQCRDKVLQWFPEYIDVVAQRTGLTDPDKLHKAARDGVKNELVFACFYGSTPKSCARRLGAPVDVGYDLVAWIWKQFPGVRDWTKSVFREYRDFGSSHTLTNRYRRSVLLLNEPINNPIQGTATDIVFETQNALAEVARREKDYTLHPRINIHDDLVFVLRDDSTLPEYIAYIGKQIVKVRFDWQIVPLMTDCRMGEHWAELMPVQKFTGDYVK